MGFLRLFLALSVIAGHSNTPVFGFWGVSGWYAVNAFFVISGFYMAMVLNEKYKELSSVTFYKSRIFRLFPTYYVGLILALVVSYSAISIHFDTLSIGSKIYFIFQNIFIVGQDLAYVFCVGTSTGVCAHPVAMTINPPAWSLAVELGFYLIAPFILKSAKKTYLFFAVGCVYLLLLNGVSFPTSALSLLGDWLAPVGAANLPVFNYYFYPSSFIFFGGGALVYHLSKRVSEPSYFLSIATVLALAFTTTVMPFWHLLFFAISIPVVFKYTKSNRVDRLVGELSYPAYILHFPILLFLKDYSVSHPQYFTFVSLGTLVAIISCCLGLVVYHLVDKRVDNYRHSREFLSARVNEGDGRYLMFSRALVLAYFLFPAIVIGGIYASQAELRAVPSKSALSLTDENWLNGVSRNGDGFVVEDKRVNIKKYVVGTVVKFSNGELRTIVRVVGSSPYLNVYLDGPALDGSVVGFPQEIEIVK